MHPDFSAAKIEKKVHKLREQIRYIATFCLECKRLHTTQFQTLASNQLHVQNTSHWMW
jgi:hypothetical protein